MITQTLDSKDCPVDATYSECAFPQIQIQIAFAGKTSQLLNYLAEHCYTLQAVWRKIQKDFT